MFHRSFTRMCVRCERPQRWRRKQQRRRWWWRFRCIPIRIGFLFFLSHAECTKNASKPLANCSKVERALRYKRNNRVFHAEIDVRSRTPRAKRLHKECTRLRRNNVKLKIEAFCMRQQPAEAVVMSHETGLFCVWFDPRSSFWLSVSFMILSQFPLRTKPYSAYENDYERPDWLRCKRTLMPHHAMCPCLSSMLDHFHLSAKANIFKLWKCKMLCACSGIDSIIITRRRLDIVHVKDCIHYRSRFHLNAITEYNGFSVRFGLVWFGLVWFLLLIFGYNKQICDGQTRE